MLIFVCTQSSSMSVIVPSAAIVYAPAVVSHCARPSPSALADLLESLIALTECMYRVSPSFAPLTRAFSHAPTTPSMKSPSGIVMPAMSRRPPPCPASSSAMPATSAGVFPMQYSSSASTCSNHSAPMPLALRIA